MRSSGVMPPSPVVVDVPTSVAARPRASLADAESAPKLMPAMVIGISSSDGPAGVPGAERCCRVAAFAVALERVAADRCGQEHQVVEGREFAPGPEAADRVVTAVGHLVDAGDDLGREAVVLRVDLRRIGFGGGHQ